MKERKKERKEKLGWFSSEQTDVHTDRRHSEAIGLADKFSLRTRQEIRDAVKE